ncbi:MAG: sulfite exporter TauE/SafE family protein, partial [Mucinivorans sp.]
MDTTIVILLVCSGLLVGVINTFAGAAAAITMALFTALGLPINVANGTNRIPVLAQTLVMSIGFARQGYLDLSAGFRLAIPTICGAVFGSLYATHVNPTIFQYLLCTILIILLCVLLFNPQRFMRNESLGNRKVRFADYFWFLLIGLYGGFFHIGIGYLILTATIVGMG